jgi:hypothetical protein
MPDWMLLIPLILLPGIAAAWFGFARRKHFSSAPADPDMEILRSLKQSGFDLTREIELSFFLYFPSAEQAQLVTAAFPPPQWRVTTAPASRTELWQCTARTRAVPTLEAIRELVAHCQGAAEAGGGEYDGWQAATATTPPG